MRKFSLKGLLEFTAGCGFLFAVGSVRDFIMGGIVCSVFAIWAHRFHSWQVRWWICNWCVAGAALFFGMACLEHVFLRPGPLDLSAHLWLFGGCGLIVGTPLAGVNGFLFLAEWRAQLRAPRASSSLASSGPGKD